MALFKKDKKSSLESELRPDSIDDLIAAVALFRPGPMENIPHYVKRKQRKV